MYSKFSTTNIYIIQSFHKVRTSLVYNFSCPVPPPLVFFPRSNAGPEILGVAIYWVSNKGPLRGLGCTLVGFRAACEGLMDFGSRVWWLCRARSGHRDVLPRFPSRNGGRTSSKQAAGWHFQLLAPSGHTSAFKPSGTLLRGHPGHPQSKAVVPRPSMSAKH